MSKNISNIGNNIKNTNNVYPKSRYDYSQHKSKANGELKIPITSYFIPQKHIFVSFEDTYLKTEIATVIDEEQKELALQLIENIKNLKDKWMNSRQEIGLNELADLGRYYLLQQNTKRAEEILFYAQEKFTKNKIIDSLLIILYHLKNMSEKMQELLNFYLQTPFLSEGQLGPIGIFLLTTTIQTSQKKSLSIPPIFSQKADQEIKSYTAKISSKERPFPYPELLLSLSEIIIVDSLPTFKLLLNKIGKLAYTKEDFNLTIEKDSIFYPLYFYLLKNEIITAKNFVQSQGIIETRQRLEPLFSDIDEVRNNYDRLMHIVLAETISPQEAEEVLTQHYRQTFDPRWVDILLAKGLKERMEQVFEEEKNKTQPDISKLFAACCFYVKLAEESQTKESYNKKAIEFGEKVLQINTALPENEKLSKELVCILYTYIGTAYKENSEFEKALKYLLPALNIYSYDEKLILRTLDAINRLADLGQKEKYLNKIKGKWSSFSPKAKLEFLFIENSNLLKIAKTKKTKPSHWNKIIKNYEEGERIYISLLESEPIEASGFQWLIDGLRISGSFGKYNQGYFNEAWSILDKISPSHQNYPETLSIRAFISIGKGEFDKAREFLQKASEKGLEPEKAEEIKRKIEEGETKQQEIALREKEKKEIITQGIKTISSSILGKNAPAYRIIFPESRQEKFEEDLKAAIELYGELLKDNWQDVESYFSKEEEISPYYKVKDFLEKLGISKITIKKDKSLKIKIYLDKLGKELEGKYFEITLDDNFNFNIETEHDLGLIEDFLKAIIWEEIYKKFTGKAENIIDEVFEEKKEVKPEEKPLPPEERFYQENKANYEKLEEAILERDINIFDSEKEISINEQIYYFLRLIKNLRDIAERENDPFTVAVNKKDPLAAIIKNIRIYGPTLGVKKLHTLGLKSKKINDLGFKTPPQASNFLGVYELIFNLNGIKPLYLILDENGKLAILGREEIKSGEFYQRLHKIVLEALALVAVSEIKDLYEILEKSPQERKEIIDRKKVPEERIDKKRKRILSAILFLHKKPIEGYEEEKAEALRVLDEEFLREVISAGKIPDVPIYLKTDKGYIRVPDQDKEKVFKEKPLSDIYKTEGAPTTYRLPHYEAKYYYEPSTHDPANPKTKIRIFIKKAGDEYYYIDPLTKEKIFIKKNPEDEYFYNHLTNEKIPCERKILMKKISEEAKISAQRTGLELDLKTRPYLYLVIFFADKDFLVKPLPITSVSTSEELLDNHLAKKVINQIKEEKKKGFKRKPNANELKLLPKNKREEIKDKLIEDKALVILPTNRGFQSIKHSSLLNFLERRVPKI